MPTIYSYTRDPYTIINSWPGWTILPAPKDPFVAVSVNNYEKVIQDKNMYIWEGVFKNPATNSVIRMYSNGDKTLVVQPLTLMVSSFTTPGDYFLADIPTATTIGENNLLTPGTFSINTWYYVYVQTKPDDTIALTIDTNPPYEYLLYRDLMGIEDTAFKFLGSFVTDGVGDIVPFTKTGQSVRYTNEQSVLTAGFTLVQTTIPLSAFIPPHSQMGMFKSDINAGGVAITAEYVKIIGNWSPGIQLKVLGPLDEISTSYFEWPVSPIQEITYEFTGGGVPNPSLDLYVVGYRE